MVHQVAAVAQAQELVSKVNTVGRVNMGNVEFWDANVVPPFKDGQVFNAALQDANLQNAKLGMGINPVQSSPTQGILDSIQSVRDVFKGITRRINYLSANGRDPSSKDLLEMQFLVLQLSYVNELSSKVSDKTSQGLQTLFRNQG
ncbi:MAG: hypothetical protein LW808_001755 [Verrucomicrobiota bacterium]|nr:MAG: hypothetical protein LW808_001755 [Verrucomicrobiota bacterium]